MIESLRKSIYRYKPPQPRYDSFWNAEDVLEIWNIPNDSLSLLELSYKTFALCSLVTMNRCSDISHLILPKVDSLVVDQEALQFFDLPRGKIPKSQKRGPIVPLRIEAFKVEKSNMCPVKTCLAYLNKTKLLRHPECEFLFVTSVKPHKHIRPATARRWLLQSLNKQGLILRPLNLTPSEEPGQMLTNVREPPSPKS